MSEVSRPPFELHRVLLRTWGLLRGKEKVKTFWMLIGIVLNGFVDILGLAAVIPVVGVVINPGLIQENDLLARCYLISENYLGITGDRQFLMLGSILLVFAFLFKAAVNLLLNWFQTRFALGVGHRISRDMWDYHFSRNLEKMRATPSGRILAEIGGWPVSLSNVFLVGALRMLNEVLVVVAISIGLVLYQPIVLLAVGCLIVVGAVLIRISTRKRLNAYSQTRYEIEPQTGTLVNGAVRGFLEVASFGAADMIRDNYLRKTKFLFGISSNQQVIAMAPAKLYEVLAVSALSGAILISLLLGKENEAFLNLLILMTLSAYRVMPSMTRINGIIMGMRSSYHVLNAMEDGVLASRRLTEKKRVSLGLGPASEVSVRITDLTCGYEDGEVPVINQLNWEFQSGKVHAVTGESGSGKSTLIYTILGLHSPSNGLMEIGSDDLGWTSLDEGNVASWLRHVGFISQNPFLFEGSVDENLAMGRSIGAAEEARIEEMMCRLNMPMDLRESNSNFQLLEGGSNLSGGQQQRLALIRALCVRRPVIVLDEATSALDEENRDVVFQLLRECAEDGCTVIMITHDRDLVRRCDTELKLG